MESDWGGAREQEALEFEVWAREPLARDPRVTSKEKTQSRASSLGVNKFLAPKTSRRIQGQGRRVDAKSPGLAKNSCKPCKERLPSQEDQVLAIFGAYLSHSIGQGVTKPLEQRAETSRSRLKQKVSSNRSKKVHETDKSTASLKAEKEKQ